jgi:hypothetical protein
MFENQNLLTADIEHHRKFVKAFDATGHRCALQKMKNYIRLLATRRVQKSILNILGWGLVHNISLKSS